MIVEITQPSSADLKSQLEALVSSLKGISVSNSRVLIDLSKLTWVYPLLVLPVATYITDTGSKVKFYPNSEDVSTYLNVVRFPHGIDSLPHSITEKTYIPIIRLMKSDRSRDKTVTEFVNLISEKVLTPSSSAERTAIQTAIEYPLFEFVANIFDHSNKDVGYIFGQYYPKKNFLDIVVVDRGRGIRRSYKEDLDLNFTDLEAIHKALEGLSTKTDSPEYHEHGGRGYGIKTSKKIVCNGLNGEFVLVSGNAAIYSKGTTTTSLTFDDFYWQGVIVSFRIPKPPPDFNILNYIDG